jgi:hypothetical protein
LESYRAGWVDQNFVENPDVETYQKCSEDYITLLQIANQRGKKQFKAGSFLLPGGREY